MQEMQGQEDPLEKEMATRASILAWEIPWTEEPGGLQPTGPQSDTTEHVCHSTPFQEERWNLKMHTQGHSSTI